MKSSTPVIDYLRTVLRDAQRVLRRRAPKTEYTATKFTQLVPISYQREGESEAYSVTRDIPTCNFRMKAVLRRDHFTDSFTVEYIREELPRSA